jgi:signal transduction histidine kinase
MKRKPQRENGHSNITSFCHGQTGSRASDSDGEEGSKKSSVEAQNVKLREEDKALREESAPRQVAEEVLSKTGKEEALSNAGKEEALPNAGKEEALPKTGKEEERQIRFMAFHHTVSEERLRRRLSSYLHDNVCQSLGIAKMKLDSLVKSISSSDSRSPLEEVTQIIQSAIKDVRSVIAELSPAVLHELGLEAGLEWLSEKFHEQNGIPCTFENDRFPKPMKEEAGILLFYSVRDLLMNVRDHAKADSVQIRALREHDKLHIVVEDDGVGFTLSDDGLPLQEEGGFGLYGIQERMSSIGGSMEIISAKGKGTCVILLAPLQP